MAKVKTHQILLQTPFDILKPDITTTLTDSLSQPLEKNPENQEKTHAFSETRH